MAGKQITDAHFRQVAGRGRAVVPGGVVDVQHVELHQISRKWRKPWWLATLQGWQIVYGILCACCFVGVAIAMLASVVLRAFHR